MLRQHEREPHALCLAYSVQSTVSSCVWLGALGDDAICVALEPADFRRHRAVGHQLEKAVPRRTIVERELCATGQELRTRRGRRHEADPVDEAVEGLVHVPPEDAAHVGVLANGAEEGGGIAQTRSEEDTSER